MHNKVVFRAAKAASHEGVPTLRFNFRGVGKSAGTFSQGVGERKDVTAALNYLSSRFAALPIFLIGFSFGASVGLSAGAEDVRVAALVGLGLPVASTSFDFLSDVLKPKLIIQGTQDQFGPRTQLEPLYASWSEPKQVHWVQDADHFFTGKLEEVQWAIGEFLRKVSGLLPGQ